MPELLDEGAYIEDEGSENEFERSQDPPIPSTKPKYDFTKRFGFYIWEIAIYSAIMFMLGVMYERSNVNNSTEKLTFKEKIFQKFGNDSAPSILYLHQHLTFPDSPNAPAKFFVAAENSNDINHFKKQISQTFDEFDIHVSDIRVVPKMSSSILFNDYLDLTSSTEKTLIFISDVNKLKDVVPLTIQRIVDPDTAPSKEAAIILTASGLKFPEKNMNKKECKIFVRKYLLNVWSSAELSEEQTEPIISRITANVLCLPSSNQLRNTEF